MNPTCGTYILQSLKKDTRGNHFSIFALKVLSVSKSFISFGKMSHCFETSRRLIQYHIVLSLSFVYLENCFFVNYSYGLVLKNLVQSRWRKPLLYFVCFSCKSFNISVMHCDSYLYQANLEKMMTCHYMQFWMLFHVWDIFYF